MQSQPTLPEAPLATQRNPHEGRGCCRVRDPLTEIPQTEPLKSCRLVPSLPLTPETLNDE